MLNSTIGSMDSSWKGTDTTNKYSIFQVFLCTFDDPKQGCMTEPIHWQRKHKHSVLQRPNVPFKTFKTQNKLPLTNGTRRKTMDVNVIRKTVEPMLTVERRDSFKGQRGNAN